jgi:hypothetical protein
LADVSVQVIPEVDVDLFEAPPFRGCPASEAVVLTVADLGCYVRAR